jgi:nitroreductase
MRKIVSILALVLSAAFVFGQDISLSKAPAKLGVDLLDAIRMRAAARTFVAKEVPVADLSTILWAADGLKGTPDAVSSASKAGGTYPVSGDVNYINLYLLNAKGVFRYVPESNLLKQISNKDARASVTPENIATAAFMLLYTCDTTKLPPFVKNNPAMGSELAVATASYSSQNAALAAGTLKLDSIVMFNIQAPAVATIAKLPKEETPLFIMQVGYTQ